MPSNPYAKLQSLKKQVAALEAKLSRNSRKLLVLPGKYGFKSMDSFVEALRAAAGSTPSAADSRAKVSGRKPRAKITPEMKNRVKEMAKQGKTGNEIAKAVGISLPSVQNIKKALGLIKKRD